MESMTGDLWAMVLARLPIKIFTCFKLVCKQWKSIVETPFFRNLFMSVHQNSASSSWSLMFNTLEEMVGQYQCDTWGLERSLGSFMASFLADMDQKHKYRFSTVKAYSDVGLILIKTEPNYMEKGVLYVANPVSRECVEIFLPIGFETNESYWDWGLVTRTENGHLLGYKVVIFDNYNREDTKLRCLIYSSETGSWSLETLLLPYSFLYRYWGYSISLNRNLYWLGWSIDLRHEVVLSIDFYGTRTGSDRCSITPFPDLEKTTKFTRACTPCQGFLMYMNIVSVTKVDGSLEDKLCLWRLQSEGWQLISEISPDLILTGLEYFPVTINPLDAKTAYFWSMEQERLLSINLHKGNYVIHNDQVERRSDPRRAMISVKIPRYLKYINLTDLVRFVLPQWLYRIPKT